MQYLDYSKLAPFLQTHFADGQADRLVGRGRHFDSGYFDIHRFFGSDGIRPEIVKIDYAQGQFAFSDERIEQFASEIARHMAAEGRLYEGPTVVRAVTDDWRSLTPSLLVQEATYGQQAGSCFALDAPHPLFQSCGGTLRDYYPTLMADHALASNPIAICYGACGIVRVTEGSQGFLLRVMRGKKLASLESSYGPSVAGSVEWATDYKTLWDMTVRTMIQEAAEELALRPAEYRIVPLAYAREIFRGEKPQIFCLVECRLSRTELEHRLLSIPDDRREFSSYDFQPLSVSGGLAAEMVASLNHEAKMNYHLLEEYLAVQA